MQNKLRVFITIILTLFYTKTIIAAEIFSIEPPIIYPESDVIVKGAGFLKDTIVILGDKTFKPFYISESSLKFNIPSSTEPATYRLILRDKDGSTLPITITVVKKEVVIYGYTPDVVDKCGEERAVTVTGKNLKEIKKVTVNGRDIAFPLQNSTLSLIIPEEIINNAGNVINVYFYGINDKIVHLLNISINHKPFIENIDVITNEFNLTSYKISGKNFVPNLILYVNNEAITENKGDLSQQNITYLQRGYQRGGSLPSPLLDRFQINSCREIIYTRYPITPEDKRIDIMIENPSGERSNTFTITAP